MKLFPIYKLLLTQPFPVHKQLNARHTLDMLVCGVPPYT